MTKKKDNTLKNVKDIVNTIHKGACTLEKLQKLGIIGNNNSSNKKKKK